MQLFDLKVSYLETPLGQMMALADEKVLYLLEFIDARGLECEVKRLRQKIATITPRATQPIHSIERELKLYFEGKLREFKTPLFLVGSPFRTLVWEELRKIPFAQTRSYSQMASAIGKPSAFRAVAQANGANQLVIVIPCHRVISADGGLGGYNSGLERKEWLLKHERLSC